MKTCLDCGIRIAESSRNVLCEYCISIYRPVKRLPQRQRKHWNFLAVAISLLLIAMAIGAFLYGAFNY